MHAITNSFSREISRHFDSYFEEYNLATSYVELILIVNEQDEITQKQLSEMMNLAPSTITRFIQKMKKSGLVEKSKSGRIATIRLTKKADAVVENMQKSYDRAVQDLEEKLGEKFVHTTEQLLAHGVKILTQE